MDYFKGNNLLKKKFTMVIKVLAKDKLKSRITFCCMLLKKKALY